MPFLSIFTQPWCLFSLLLLIVLLLIAAALLSRGRHSPRQPHEPDPQLSDTDRRIHELAASAPFEALQALGERLAELQRHLPPASADALWLESFRNDLRNVMDDVYWELFNGSGVERAVLLERLGSEVEHLEQTISQRLSTTISSSTDRQALHRQLEQLRRIIDQ